MPRQPLTDDDGEVRELTEEDFRRMRPAAEVLPPELLRVLTTRPAMVTLEPSLEPVTIPLDLDVLEHFQRTGEGWQARINDILRKAAGL